MSGLHVENFGPGPDGGPQPGDTVSLIVDGATVWTRTVDTTSDVLPPVSRPVSAPPGLIHADELQVGRRYVVEFDDCCVKGEFTSTLIEATYDERCPTYPESLRWENGVTLDEWGQAEFREAD